MTRYEKILGGLTLAAAGDAIGAATETRSTELIREFFGELVRDFRDAPMDTFARGTKAGTVTDDFSLAYETAKAIIDRGTVDEEAAKNALLTWSETPFYAYAGPTTRAAVNAMKGIPTENYFDFLACDNSKASNGGAMKIEAVGYINPGNLDGAVRDAITLCMPTHPNDIGLSGACAVAAACAQAVTEQDDMFSVVRAGLYGAKEGMRIGGEVGKKLAGPSVYKRIKLACDIALRCDSLEEAMTEISDLIGTGLPAAEAVPSAFGLIVASDGDPVEAMLAGVNIGSDTDTIATIIGSIAGAMSGIEALPVHYLPTVDEVNGYDLKAVAKGLDAIAEKRANA